MKLDELKELISCLPEGRTLFTYGKDLYAAQLLSYQLQTPQAIHELRNSPFAHLIQKPKIRQHLGKLGKSVVSADDLKLFQPDQFETFRLKLDHYHGMQTSRKGKTGHNLVLQLNLNQSEHAFLKREVVDREKDPFEFFFHPIHRGAHRTLAWARIDLDLETGEALIEEVQNDRIRECHWMLNYMREFKQETYTRLGITFTKAFVEAYWNRYLAPLAKIWDEAMLSAAIKFIREELGLKRIFYHTMQSNKQIKRDGADEAPRSIYTKLPSRFGFVLTDEAPSFLSKRKGSATTPFQLMDLAG